MERTREGVFSSGDDEDAVDDVVAVAAMSHALRSLKCYMRVLKRSKN